MEDLTTEEIILAGLGKAGNRSSSRKMSLRNAAKGEMGASRYRIQFLERIHKLPKEIQMALKQGKAQIADSPYYSTAEIRGTASKIIKTSVSEEIGITNLDNGKLGKNRYLTLSGIKLLYDANSINGAFTDPFPADLLNGEWELELDGKIVLPKEPIRKFFDGFYGYNINKPFGLYPLDNPKDVLPQSPIEVNIETKNEVTGFLKVFLEGTIVYGY